MKTKVALLGMMIVISCCSLPPPSEEVALMESLEGQLALPNGAQPISKYDRFYYIGLDIIEGMLILSENGKGKVRFVSRSELPTERRDGGCGVIQVTFERKRNTWASVICNGRA